MNTLATVIYHCRLCGEKVRGPQGNGEIVTRAVMMLMITGETQLTAGPIIAKTSSHTCEDGSCGITDISGIAYGNIA